MIAMRSEEQEQQQVPDPLMPWGGDWTVQDLAGLPDDGLKYELLDGVLVVSPVPTPRHQMAVGRLTLHLGDRCPDGPAVVLLGPLDYQPDATTSVQPDVLVVREEDIGKKNITNPLLLAVEVLSDYGRIKDQRLKRDVYERTGVTSFWVVDPDVPSLVAYDLVDGAYVEVASGTGDEEVELRSPFPVTIVPADLLTA
jgi:Uma2 family endonuclease